MSNAVCPHVSSHVGGGLFVAVFVGLIPAVSGSQVPGQGGKWQQHSSRPGLAAPPFLPAAAVRSHHSSERWEDSP